MFDIIGKCQRVAARDCGFSGDTVESCRIQRDCRAADHVVAEFARVNARNREEFVAVFGRGARQRRGVVREGVARSLAGCIVGRRAALEARFRVDGVEVEISELGTGDCVGGVGDVVLREDARQIQRDDVACCGDHSLICSSDCRVQSFGHAAQVRHGEGVRVAFRRAVVVVARDFVAVGRRCEVSVGVSTLVVDGRPVGRECRSVLFVVRQLRAFGDNQAVVIVAAVEDDVARGECAFRQRDCGAADRDFRFEAFGVEAVCQAADCERRRGGCRVIGEAVRHRRVVSLFVGGSVGVGAVRDREGRSRFRRTGLRSDCRAVVGDRQRVVVRVVAVERDIQRAALRQVEHVGRQRDSPLAVVAFHRFGQGHAVFDSADREGVAVRLRFCREGVSCGSGGFSLRPVLGNGVGRLVSCNVACDCRIVPSNLRGGCLFNGGNVGDRQLVSVRAFVGERDGRCACLCDVEVFFGQRDCAVCGGRNVELFGLDAADREEVCARCRRGARQSPSIGRERVARGLTCFVISCHAFGRRAEARSRGFGGCQVEIFEREFFVVDGVGRVGGVVLREDARQIQSAAVARLVQGNHVFGQAGHLRAKVRHGEFNRNRRRNIVVARRGGRAFRCRRLEVSVVVGAGEFRVDVVGAVGRPCRVVSVDCLNSTVEHQRGVNCVVAVLVGQDDCVLRVRSELGECGFFDSDNAIVDRDGGFFAGDCRSIRQAGDLEGSRGGRRVIGVARTCLRRREVDFVVSGSVSVFVRAREVRRLCRNRFRINRGRAVGDRERVLSGGVGAADDEVFGCARFRRNVEHALCQRDRPLAFNERRRDVCDVRCGGRNVGDGDGVERGRFARSGVGDGLA